MKWGKDLVGSDPDLIYLLFRRFPLGTEEITKISVTIAGVQAEIRIENLTNMSEKRYLYTSKMGLVI